MGLDHKAPHTCIWEKCYGASCAVHFLIHARPWAKVQRFLQRGNCVAQLHTAGVNSYHTGSVKR